MHVNTALKVRMDHWDRSTTLDNFNGCTSRASRIAALRRKQAARRARDVQKLLNDIKNRPVSDIPPPLHMVEARYTQREKLVA